MRTGIICICLFYSTITLAQDKEKAIFHEDGRITTLLRNYKAKSAVYVQQYVYRVQLISTYKRDEANRIQSKFRNLFPEEPSFLQYDGVKFIVRAGSFASKTDADMKLKEFRKTFPASFILPPEKVKE